MAIGMPRNNMPVIQMWRQIDMINTKSRCEKPEFYLLLKLIRTVYMHTLEAWNWRKDVLKTYKSYQPFNMGDKNTPAYNTWQWGCRATTRVFDPRGQGTPQRCCIGWDHQILVRFIICNIEFSNSRKMFIDNIYVYNSWKAQAYNTKKMVFC